jgi:dTDP-4-amino-4,6-dideoxygalactose transaminase
MGGQELEFIREAFESNYIAPLGPMVDAFEKDFVDYTGIGHCVAVASGTAAMHLALHCLDISRGDEVLVSTLTFIGSVTPVVYLGATPIFMDSDRVSWNMSPVLLEEELEASLKRGRRPKAIVPTDIYGQCADVESILELGKRFEVPVISDSAEALGAQYGGRHAGKGTAAAIFSFNGNKIITTSGGGMLASDNELLIDRARFLSQQARDPGPHYEHSEIGYNYRMSNILAAIGRGQLRILDEGISKRRDIFAVYQEGLKDLPGIQFMPEAPYGRCTRWLTVILISPEEFGANRETVRLALEADNIESRPVLKPMHLQQIFRGCKIRGGSVSEDLFDRGLCLPSGTELRNADLERIVSIIRKCRRNIG